MISYIVDLHKLYSASLTLGFYGRCNYGKNYMQLVYHTSLKERNYKLKNIIYF